jgi:hypothetical protein
VKHGTRCEGHVNRAQGVNVLERFRWEYIPRWWVSVPEPLAAVEGAGHADRSRTQKAAGAIRDHGLGINALFRGAPSRSARTVDGQE